MRANPFSKLALNSALYSLGSFAGMAVSVLMLPFYSRMLSVEDYGAVDLMSQYTNFVKSLVAPAFVYGALTVFHRERTLDVEKAKGLAIWTSVFCLAGLGLVLAIATILGKEVLRYFLLGNQISDSYFLLSAAVVFLDLCSHGLYNRYLIEGMAARFLYVNVIRLLLNASCVYFLLKHFHMGGGAFLLGNCLSSIPILLFMIVGCMQSYRTSFSWSVALEMARVGTPMIPTSFLANLMHNGDRFLLSRYSTLENAGGFAMASQFPSALNTLLLSSFNNAWLHNAMFERKFQKEQSVRAVALIFMWFFITMQGCRCLMVPSIFKLLVDDKFFSFMSLVPVVSMGFCVHALYIFASTENMRYGNFSKLAIATLLAVIAKLTLGTLLIRQYADLGAAMSFLCTYCFFIIICLAVNGKRTWSTISPLRMSCLFMVGFSLWFFLGRNISEVLSVYDTLKFGLISAIIFVALSSFSAFVILYKEVQIALSWGKNK